MINIGSVAGDAAYAGGGVYCATKAAVKLVLATHQANGTVIHREQ